MTTPVETLSSESCLDFAAGRIAADPFGENSDFLSSLFVLHFNRVPNKMLERRINCRKANDWLLTASQNDIRDYHYAKGYNQRGQMTGKQSDFNSIRYVLFDDLLINFDFDYEKVDFLFRKTDASKVQSVVEGIQKFKHRKVSKTPTINMLVNGNSGLSTTSLTIARPKLTIEDNYNDDFLPVHQIISRRLSKKDDKGLVLLHGKPGTGKTSYIRYLLSKIRKKVIFLPPNMAASITDPGLMKVLVNNSNSIFVIEDAENIIIDRNRQAHSPVSALLNLSDGLLSDCLNIQIICSFNTDLSRIDSALMRKGRLIANYEFRELTAAKAQALSDRLGFHAQIDAPMLLTDIYNQHENGFASIPLRKVVGFNNL
jgi:hypothetical protein